MKINDICFVRAKIKDDYVFDAIKQYGFETLIPYKDKNLLLRLLREAWYKLKLPGRQIWYNKEIKKIETKAVIVLDPLISPDFLTWLHKTHACARIVLQYENRADTTINPNTVPDFVEKWSYDLDDCEKYYMKLIHPYYFDMYRFESENDCNKEYDVLYLGRDKGRMEQILKYENFFKSQGFRTYFHVCADRSFFKFKNPNYKSVMSYSTYLELLKKSNSILNIVRDGQKSITQRELEAVFDNMKCITTNKAIKEFELYDKNRYFILGVDSLDEFKHFMSMPLKKVPQDKLKEYFFPKVIENTLLD